MSLRVRLSIIVSLLFFSGLVLGMSFLISNAKQRVANEIESSAMLTYELLSTLLDNSATSLFAQDKTRLIEDLSAINNVRHLDISIESAQAQGSILQTEYEINAPAWFVHFVKPEPLELRIQIDDTASEVIVIRTNPADEISEIWVESKSFMLVLSLVLIILNTILFISVGRWFEPVNLIIQGLDNVEQGDFSQPIPKASLPELKVIVEKVNQLTRVLQRSKQENNRLAQRSLNIQEEERRYLSQALHDEMGQSISAIKAIAFSISQRMSPIDKKSVAGADKIQSIANTIRDHVRSLMTRLRPGVLDELGLIPALEVMIDEWNDHHTETFCSFKISEQFETLEDQQKINIYRIIQEALTNTARHAKASEVCVSLYLDGKYHLVIQDNGQGFELNQLHKGLGLAGIKERSLGLNGHCEIQSAKGEGFMLSIEF